MTEVIRIGPDDVMFFEDLPLGSVTLKIAPEVERLEIRAPGVLDAEEPARIDIETTAEVELSRLPLDGGEWIGLKLADRAHDASLVLTSQTSDAIRHVLVRVAACTENKATGETFAADEMKRIVEKLLEQPDQLLSGLAELPKATAQRAAEEALRRFASSAPEPGAQLERFAPFLMLFCRT